ncbi:helix-turn-helix domain-containing protein [Longimicrobium sp.]|uniref:helix-turn-helix domain-containing protein n=1 Tax=Longimicrobium sp. TaxID=2029185 RepID=UPI002E33D1EB|nr:helix-turn-helix domain-containing protein [Longimicrobium sp.]HEX6042275.1 helix-turn-helix domain-containing protein [Longimicrobium sp.]
MRDEDFQELLGAVQEAVEHYEGRRHDLRTTVLPAVPQPMSAAAIRALRDRIGASQAVFAMALNVSTKTVQAWESGARVPDGGNLKLLRVGEAHPEAVFGSLCTPPSPAPSAAARPASRASTARAEKPRASGRRSRAAAA